MDARAGVRVERIAEYNDVLDYSKKPLGYRFIKRVFDVVASCLGLIVLSPVFLITSLAILAEDGGPVFYTQIRIGKDCKAFKMYKFRSMIKNAEQLHEELREKEKNVEISFKLKNDPRITKVGYIIRKFNIDELPQLMNILMGSMSIVGPRPLPYYEFEEEQRQFGNKYSERYSVPQGLTCYWQIANRSEVDFDTRMQMDVDYARECSWVRDISLIIRTFVYTVLGKAGY